MCVCACQLNPFDDITHYTLAVLYIIGMIFEILLPCYYGSEVSAKSEQLGPLVFRSNWLEQSQRFRAAMLIFAERAKRSIAPFAGGLFALALPTFVSVRSRRHGKDRRQTPACEANR